MDEIDLRNTIINLRDEISDLEREKNNLEDRLDISRSKEDSCDRVLIFIKDRRDHSQAIGDQKAFEIYKEILKHA